MKTVFAGWMLTALLPLAMAGEKPRVMFGVVPSGQADFGENGLLVRAVLSGSPADKARLEPGDRIVKLNDTPVNTREDMLKILLSLEPGQTVSITYCKAGTEQPTHTGAVLVARPESDARAADSPDAAVGGDRRLRPLVVTSEIRQAMRAERMAVVAQLALLPGGFVPEEVSDHLQAIRNLARDANPEGRGWMHGKAGEVTLQFKDDQGVLVLHGASNKLTLTVYNAEGHVLHTLPLNTPEERAAVPAAVIERLRALR